MNSSLENTIALLTRTPAALDALLRDLPEVWTAHNERGNTWTPPEIVAHLISGERTDWMPRTRIVLQHGTDRTFQPFDMEGYRTEAQGKSLAQLLDEFARLRSHNLEDLRALDLTEEDMEKRGRHPELGDVTLGQLLATWPAHDLTHLHQLVRVLGYQYKDAVGPWSAYMGVMRCMGHSTK